MTENRDQESSKKSRIEAQLISEEYQRKEFKQSFRDVWEKRDESDCLASDPFRYAHLKRFFADEFLQRVHNEAENVVFYRKQNE